MICLLLCVWSVCHFVFVFVVGVGVVYFSIFFVLVMIYFSVFTHFYSCRLIFLLCM